MRTALLLIALLLVNFCCVAADAGTEAASQAKDYGINYAVMKKKAFKAKLSNDHRHVLLFLKLANLSIFDGDEAEGLTEDICKLLTLLGDKQFCELLDELNEYETDSVLHCVSSDDRLQDKTRRKAFKQHYPQVTKLLEKRDAKRASEVLKESTKTASTSNKKAK